MYNTLCGESFLHDYLRSVLEKLHYEERSMYNFRTIVYDVVRNSSEMVTLLQVNDVPNLDPKWTKPFSSARFLEKKEQVKELIDTSLAEDLVN